MIALLLASQLWAAPYRQTFHVQTAVPLQLRYHSTAGFSSEDWEASLIVVTTSENATFKLACSRNSGWKIYDAQYLETSTSFASGFRESRASVFLEDTGSAAACSARIQDVLDDPGAFTISILDGKKAELTKREVPKT